jgi:Spy/CpxP family protein refolding chaperone
MLRKRFALIIALAALAVVVLTGCYRTPEQKAEHFVNYMVSELKLNDTQKAQLEKIKDEFLAKRPEFGKLREESVKEANELMRSPEIDKAKLNALVEKNQSKANEMIGFFFTKFAEIHDILTPEQREKLVTHIEKHYRSKHKTEKEPERGSAY